MNLLELLSLLSLVALSLDLALQSSRILRTKSSQDISVLGDGIRLLATSILLVKFLSIHDGVLSLGQTILLVTFLVYFGLVLHYRHAKKKSKKKR